MMSRMISLVGVLAVGFAVNQSAAATPAPAAGLLPLEQFTRHDEFGTIKLSPEGDFVAMSIGKYGRSALVFMNLATQKVTGGVKAPEGYEISEFHWVSPTRVIYMKAERLPGKRFAAFTGEIYAVDRDGTKQRQLYGYGAGERVTGTKMRVREASYATPELISALRSDDRNVLIAEFLWRSVGETMYIDRDARARYSLLDVYTGMRKELGVSPLGGGGLLVDSHDRVRFAIGMNAESRTAVSWKNTPEAAWAAFDLPGFDAQELRPIRFSTDDRSVFFIGAREDEPSRALYSLNLETRAVGKVGGFDAMDVQGVVTDFSDRDIVGYFGYGDGLVYRWLDENDAVAKLYTSLSKAFPGQSVDITSASDDGRLAIAFVSSDVNPGEYYLFDTQKKKADFLRATRAWIDPRLMRPKQPIQVTARDGLVLNGYLTKPAGEGPQPLVVLPHGGPHGIRDDGFFDSEVQLLANRGYAVLQINYRGSGGYGEKFERAGFREWGGRMQDDVTDATRWAIEQKVASAGHICIFGTSYGAYAALMGAVREPKLYRCAIGVAGVYDLELMLSSADIADSRSGRAYLQEVLGDDVAQLRSRSPAYHAQLIEVPVLLVHGKADWRADFEQAKRMKAALEDNHKQLEWIALSGEGHGIYEDESRRQVYERLLAFLDRHLMQAPAAD